MHMGAGHSPHKVRPSADGRTAQRPENEAKKDGAKNKPRNPEPVTRNTREEQPEEKEPQVGGRANGVLEREKNSGKQPRKGKERAPTKSSGRGRSRGIPKTAGEADITTERKGGERSRREEGPEEQRRERD